MSRNITYATDAIAQYYSANRTSWDAFYPSERAVVERLARDGRLGSVLDVGCAVGGLGLALEERFDLAAYTGIDINAPAIAAARNHTRLRAPSQFLADDVLTCDALGGRTFDTVFSLSAADWNVETHAIIDRCWDCVAPGGQMVISLRLTPQEGAADMARSYQFIHFGPADTIPADAERAGYVVFNVREALALLGGLSPAPDQLYGYGYWGRPSATARTPFERLVFAVFSLHKPAADQPAGIPEVELRLPLDALL